METKVKNWLNEQYFWNTISEKRPVDFLYSKAFNTVDFYFEEIEDVEWYENLCKEKYKTWCEENFDKLKEEDKKEKIKEKTWKEYFEKREIYPDFISELFITVSMLEELMKGKNPKKVRNKFK